MIRSRAEEFHIRPDRIAVCGFSAGAHLCGSLCVHNKDVEDPEEAYQNISNRPDVAILSYPVITSGKYAHRDSFVALFGKEPSEQELDYMSLENHVTKDTPPCFLCRCNILDSSGGEQLSLCTGLCTGWCTICTACIFRRNPWTICGNRRVVRAEYRTGRRKKDIHRNRCRCLQRQSRPARLHFQRKGEELLVKFGIGRKKPARWTEKQKRGNPQNAERSTELDAACRSVDGEISESGIEENKGYRHFKTVWQSNL